MKGLLRLISLVILVPIASFAQTVSPATPTSPTDVPKTDDLLQTGEVDGVTVLDVEIMTTSDTGPFTRFYVSVPGHTNPFTFYVRGNDNTSSFERGVIVGLLMGAAETYRSTSYSYQTREEHEGTTVNLYYKTVQGRREIIAASLAGKIQR